jgi:hypothetical protein
MTFVFDVKLDASQVTDRRTPPAQGLNLETLRGRWGARDLLYRARRAPRSHAFIPVDAAEERSIRWWRGREVGLLPDVQQSAGFAELAHWHPPAPPLR